MKCFIFKGIINLRILHSTMSKFNCCYRYLHQYIERSAASYAWIELHRCVEAYANTTGISFTGVFEELEEKFRFNRKIRHQWPGLEQMRQAADQLKTSRDAFLRELNPLIVERKQEKKTGKRPATNQELIRISHKQNEQKKLRVGFWGWERMRHPLILNQPCEVVQLDLRNEPDELNAVILKSGYQLPVPFLADAFIGEDWKSAFKSFFKEPRAVLTLSSPHWDKRWNKKLIVGDIWPESPDQCLVSFDEHRIFLMSTARINQLINELRKTV